MEKIERYILVECEKYFTDFNELPKDILEYCKMIGGVQFHCPCGCGIQVYLPVSTLPEEPKQDRVWRFIPATCTITPSIQQTGHCGSHYHIENGAVRWG